MENDSKLTKLTEKECTSDNSTSPEYSESAKELLKEYLELSDENKLKILCYILLFL